MNYSKRFFNITRSRCEFQQGAKKISLFRKTSYSFRERLNSERRAASD